MQLYVNRLGRRVYRPIPPEPSDERRELVPVVGSGNCFGL